MEKMNWKGMLIVFGIFLFALVIFLTGGKSTLWNSVALGGLMIFFWVFEVIPIYVTALLPLILSVPLGVLTKEDLASQYGDGNVYLFFGGFILALGIEKWKVHEQVSYFIIKRVGQSKPRILLGFIMSTGFLSMWMSNTATALMMLPMAIAINNSLPDHGKKGKFPVFLLLSVAYAASIGGMATLIGSPTNTAMASYLMNTLNIKVDFLTWMSIGMPVSILMLLATFGFFYFSLGAERNTNDHQFSLQSTPWTREQKMVSVIFLGVLAAWILKDFMNDWFGFSYRDENAAILGGILMLVIPGTTDKKPLLNWKDTEKLPWGILLLFGGGLAMAKMFEKNGVIDALTKVFTQFSDMPLLVILLIVVTIAIFVTEIMSNLALVQIFVPLVAAFAMESGLSVVQLCVPLTLAASCAFMLPVGTPPNAIVFSSGQIHIHQMVKVGFVLNIIGVIIITLAGILYY